MHEPEVESSSNVGSALFLAIAIQRIARMTIVQLTVDRGAGVPIHRQISEAVRRAIVGGRLRPGQRLPATRTLAQDLGVSRLPVLTAYEHLLQEGYLEGRVGAGTFVSATHPRRPDSVRRPAPRAAARRRPAPTDAAPARPASFIPSGPVFPRSTSSPTPPGPAWWRATRTR